jgi:hypothetical protein
VLETAIQGFAIEAGIGLRKAKDSAIDFFNKNRAIFANL